MAWRIPPAMAGVPALSSEKPAGSMVPWAQSQLFQATRQALAAISKDVAEGLAETVGIRCAWAAELKPDEPCSVVLELPEGTDTETIATAIDMENVEAWRDTSGYVHVGIGPWYTTKDIDQVVLSITKVVHVMLGLHAGPGRTQTRA
ncbi:MAG: hypothetical protein ACKV2V_03155 [Blastocatellia bacterium]